MNYYELFLRGGFIGLLVKYEVNVRRWSCRHHLILILMVLLGFVSFHLFHTYHIETKWRLLITALVGLTGGWLLSLNLFRYLGVNRNAFLRKVYPMEFTSTVIPTIISILNKKEMMWFYFFWLIFLMIVEAVYTVGSSNIYVYIFQYVVIYSMWISENFFLVLYFYYKKIS